MAAERLLTALALLIVAAVAFIAWMLAPVVDDQLLRAEVGYAGAALLLCALLAVVYRVKPVP